MTEKERKETIQLMNWTVSIMMLVFFVLVYFAFIHVRKNEQQANQHKVSLDREWRMIVLDEHDVLLTDNGDTLCLSFESTDGLKDINPIVFTDVYQ